MVSLLAHSLTHSFVNTKTTTFLLPSLSIFLPIFRCLPIFSIRCHSTALVSVSFCLFLILCLLTRPTCLLACSVTVIHPILYTNQPQTTQHLVPPRTHSPIHIHIPSPIPPSNPPPPTRWIPIYALDYQYLSAERRATFFGCFVARPGHRSYIHRPRPWTLDPLISPHLCTTQCRADPPVVRRSVPLPLLQPAKSIHSFWSWRLPAADESGFWLWVEGQGFRARGRADIDVRIVFVCTTTIHTPAHQPRLPRRETS